MPLANDGDESFGDIDLTTALTQLGQHRLGPGRASSVGKPTMAKYMKRFGFYAKPPLDLPADQRGASGEFGSTASCSSPTSDSVDVGRMGIGQDKLAVTPLQMAMVASAIANGGTLMKPHLDRPHRRPRRPHRRPHPADGHAQVMKQSTADQVGAMMQTSSRRARAPRPR